MKALKDLYFLLNRGYKKDIAVKFVSDHYRLKKKDRYKLMRIVFSEREIESVKRKKCEIKDIKNKSLAVDGYNVLITTESVLENKAFLCFDGVIRDTKGIFKKYKFTERSNEALEKIFLLFRKYPPKEALFFFDVQISKSGELCSLIRENLEKYNLRGDAKAVKNVDYTLKKLQMLTATNDSAIIKYLENFVDIPKWIWERMKLVTNSQR